MSRHDARLLSDAALMREVGVAVFGLDWRRPLARELGCSHQLLAAIASGRLGVSPDVRGRLAAWAAARQADDVRERVERAHLLAEAAARSSGHHS